MNRPDQSSADSSASGPCGSARFAETHWSMVLRAGEQGDPGAAAALERLCGLYWYPVYAWIRGAGSDPEDSRDLTQEFFATLLRRDSLSTVDPEKGRFRTFMIRSLQNFLVDQHRHRSAEKRGGGRTLMELDAVDPEERYRLEPVSRDSPDAEFDRRWGQSMVIRAMERLAAEQTAEGRVRAWGALAGFIGSEPEPGEYAAAAALLQAPLNTVAVLVRRLRLRCRELIMEEILHTVPTRSAAAEELRALFGK